MYEISFLILGAILISLPISVITLKRQFEVYKTSCQKVGLELQETLQKLNHLHNSSVKKNEEIIARLTKIESEKSAQKLGKM